MKLYSIETGNFMLDGGALFGVVPKSIWEKRYPANEKNLCNICMRCLLIQTEDKLILIDAGLGNTMDESLLKYYFLNGNDTLNGSLNKHGFNVNDITDVIFTHLHFDHCGGAVTKNNDNTYELTFPNAKYWISEQHWNSVKNPNRREKPSFLKNNIEPLEKSGKIEFINSQTEIYPGIELRIYNGHTVGQIIPFIKYNNKTLVYCGDFIPTAAHLPVSFVCGYDISPLTTLEETESFLQVAANKEYTLFFEHDINTECCTVIDSPKGVILKDSFPLSKFI